MSDRTAYQIQLRIIKQRPGNRMHNDYEGTPGEEYEPGTLLTNLVGGRVSAIEANIGGDIATPVRAIAIGPYEGEEDTRVPVEEIDADTVLVGQYNSATGEGRDLIGLRAAVAYDATTGFYMVSADTGLSPSVEIVDVERNHSPYAPNAYGAYPLVWFKFLPSVIGKAPGEESS